MYTRNSSRLFALIAGVLLAGGLFVCRGARAGTDAHPTTHSPEKTTVDIASGNAANALAQLAMQYDVDILFDSNVVKNTTTPAVSGLLSFSEALERALRGTGLGYVIVGDHMVTVMPKESPPKPASIATVTVDTEPRTRPAEVLVEAARRERFGGLSAGSQHIAFYSLDAIQRSGASTLQALLRTQSQIFGGGPSEDTVIGRETGTNSLSGSGVNLRGLDAGATLILIDGRRVAPSGSSGAFADISNIPLSAVQSVEILPDATATPWGADAPGGVVNITMRDSFVGGQAHASFGAVTNGALQEHLYDALWGTRLPGWQGGRALFAFEYYDRDKLAADDRSQVTGNLTPLGGGDYSIEYGNPGTILAGGQSWAIPRTHTGTASDYVPGTVNTYNLYKGTTILPGQRRLSGLARLHFDLSDQLDTFVDTLVTSRDVTADKAAMTADLTVPATNPYYFNPAGGKDPVTVKYGFYDDLGPQTLSGNVTTINAAGGLNWSYRDWHASAMLDYASEVENQHTSGLVNFEALQEALAQSDPAKAFDPFGVGSHTSAKTLADIRASRGFHSNSDYYGGRLDVDGALLHVPAGSIKIGAGLEYRHQTLNEVFTQTAPQVNERQDLGRNIRSAFAQLWVPIFGPEQHIKGMERLEVSAAARLDDYSDVGRATAPSFGIDWSPFSQISFRGTLSRTFRPPNLVDLSELNNQSLLFGLPDKSAPSGVTQTLIWSGNNAQLTPESARSWTIGVTLKPALIPASSLAFTFFDISLRSRFDQQALTLGALDDSAFQDRITRNPSQALRATVCQHSTFQGSTAACEAAPIGAIVDLRVRNLAALRTRGIDLLGQLERSLDRGTLSAELEGTYLLEYAATQTPSLPATSLLNRQNEPINLRLRGSGYWQYRNLQLSTVVVYANHYRDWASSPPRNIASWTTVDLTASYAIVPASLSLLANTTVSLTVQNVFDRAPPYINNTTTFLGYDQENGNLLGRFLSVSLRKQW